MLLYPWEEIEETLPPATTLTGYMREGERAQVQWVGNPLGFGFGGEPSQDGAMMMFEGLAGNGERLAREAKEVGIDFTFSIGKDLSILYVLGDEDLRSKIDWARTRAIERTMAVAERDYMRVRRGSGKDESKRVAERPAAWIGIRYSHSSNREGEPLIHDHVHVSTLVQNREGGFQRLWSRALFARGGAVLEALGHRHEAELREAISEELPGIRWGELGENGTALVGQVPEALRDALSTRTRKRIDPVVAEWEAANRMPATSAVRQMIALQTRQKKDLAAVMAREQVQTVALQHGVDEMTMLREIVTAPPAKQREHPAVSELADQVVSTDGLTKMTTAFRLPAVQLAVSRAGVPASHIDTYVSQIVEDPRVVRIETVKEVKWTTLELVERERSLIGLLTSREGQNQAPVVEAQLVERLIADQGATPNAGQLAAVHAFTGAPAPTVLIEANAGTGKTYVAGLANKVWEHAGIPVLGAAPTGKAVTELKAAGVQQSRTFASLANHISQDRPLVELTGGVPGILLGDELTMVHTREAELVLRTAVQEGFVVRGMGHSAQLQSVQAGGWFKQVTHQHRDELGDALLRLDQVIRQKSTDEGKALNELAARTPHEWVAYQEQHGRLRGYGLSPRERHQATIDAVSIWLEREGEDVLLISPTNRLRQDLNILAQARWRDIGRLAGEPLGIQTSEGDTVQAGEKLILKRNDRTLGVDNGTRATAIGRVDGGLLIQVGDRDVLLPADYVADHVRLGYAVTIHDSQGATADHAIVVTPVKNLDSELAYVAASRARHTTTVLVLTDPDPGCKHLKARLRLEGAEETATTHMQAANGVLRDQTHAFIPRAAGRTPEREKAQSIGAAREAAKQIPGAAKVGPPVETESLVPAAASQAPQWPVSKPRDALAELDLTLERAKEAHAEVMQDAAEKAERIRELDEQIQQITNTAHEDAQTTKRRHRDELEARQALRQEQLNRLSASRAQLPIPPDRQMLADEFIAYRVRDRHGVTRLAGIINMIRPVVVMIVNDVGLVAQYLAAISSLEHRPRVVAYMPVDSGPVALDHLRGVASLDGIVVYNRFAAELLAAASDEVRYDDPAFVLPPVSIIPHGVDTKVFRPLFPIAGNVLEARKAARHQLLPQSDSFADAFIVLNANRNQPRKRIDITIAGFARFAADKPGDVRLYLHMGMTDIGWNILELARRHGIMDQLIITHDGDHPPGSTPEQLNRIYNACDVGINTSEAESWGLTAFEHAATGAAQIVPGHTGTREIWDGAAEMLPSSLSLTSPGSLTTSELIDPQTVAVTLERLYRNPELLQKRSLTAYQHATEPRYGWDTVAGSFDEILTDLAEQHEDNPGSRSAQKQMTALTATHSS